eukprot:jgi/Chlat1/7478/Chrsp6S07478
MRVTRSSQLQANLEEHKDVSSQMAVEDASVMPMRKRRASSRPARRQPKERGRPASMIHSSPRRRCGASPPQTPRTMSTRRSPCQPVEVAQQLKVRQVPDAAEPARPTAGIVVEDASMYEVDEEVRHQMSLEDPDKASTLDTIFSPVYSLYNPGSDACDMDVSATLQLANMRSSSETKPVVEQSLAMVAVSKVDTLCTYETTHSVAYTLECEDDSMDDEDSDAEEDAFDPFIFIANLPPLSQCISPPHAQVLPKKTRRSPPLTLVLDLDETLVHSSLDDPEEADFTFPVFFNNQEHNVYVRRRPGLDEFMQRVSQLFEVVVFTASQRMYAERLLNILDPNRTLIRHRIFRDSCVFVEGNYLKDLTVLGRDLSQVAIVDNSPQAFGYQLDNGIPIESWFDDREDTQLLSLLPFLEKLVGQSDVRPLIAQQFQLKEKIAQLQAQSTQPAVQAA